MPARRLRTAWLGVSLAAVAFLGPRGPAQARADDAMSAQMAAQRDLARSRFRLGRAHQDARAYDQAIIEYQAAYALAPMPEMLFNIGQCYRLKGDGSQALVYYERYLQQVPEGGASRDARAHIAALRPEAARTGVGTTSSRSGAGSEPGASIRGDDRDGGSADRGDPGGRTWRWIGAGSAIAGAAFVGAGVWSGLEAADAADGLEAARGPVTPELLALERDGQAAEDRMWVFTGVGVALVLAGGVTWWLSGRAQDAPRPGLGAAPVLGPGHAGLVVTGRF